MNKTKIDWATMSWNPVTGCRHGCPYCYARRTATRFNAGLEDPAPLAGGLHVLPEKIKATPYPYGFEPTMHRSGAANIYQHRQRPFQIRVVFALRVRFPDFQHFVPGQDLLPPLRFHAHKHSQHINLRSFRAAERTGIYPLRTPPHDGAPYRPA